MTQTCLSPSTTQELALTLDLDRDSDSGLLRAISLLHRRHCRVTTAEYRTGDGPYARLELRIQPPTRHAHRVQTWLSALVEVHHVAAGGAANCD